MIARDRILGGVVAGGGAFLLLHLIPNYVTAMPGKLRDPSLFPRIAAWMLLGLGILQILLPGPDGALPAPREIGRGAMVIAALTAAVLALPHVGFIATSVALMVFSAALMFETRALWLATIVVFVPVGTWALFEIVFARPMP